MRQSNYKNALESARKKESSSFEKAFVQHMLIHEYVQKEDSYTPKSLHPIVSDVDTTKLFVPQD